jgi:Na+/melibiose symporter-like transporter
LGLVVSPILGGIWGSLDDESVLSLTAAYTTIGLLVGMAQWLFLRGHFTKSLVWLLSSGVGLGLGTGLVLVSNLIHQSGIVSIILVALVYAIATGLVLSWLPASHRKTESNLVNAT